MKENLARAAIKPELSNDEELNYLFYASGVTGFVALAGPIAIFYYIGYPLANILHTIIKFDKQSYFSTFFEGYILFVAIASTIAYLLLKTTKLFRKFKKKKIKE